MKAHIRTSDGVEVQMDGTPAELAAVLKEIKLKGDESPKTSKSSTPGAKESKAGLPGLIHSLKGDGFFRKPQSLNQIRLKLKDLGHNYPLTSLSPAMARVVRKRSLRRFKENNKYVYAQ